MNNLSYDQLKQHVKIIYDLETSLFQQKMLIEKLKKCCATRLGAEPDPPQKPSKISAYQKSVWAFLGSFVVGGVLVVLPFVLNIGIGWKILIGLFSIPFGTVVLSELFKEMVSDTPPPKTAEEETAEYETNLIKYNLELASYHKSVYQQEQARQSLLPLQKKQAETQRLLQDVYNRGIIHPKYRNFVAISSIYEYLDTGRCQVLTGHEGAYNCYENDCRANLIISLLTQILANLQGIKENQFMLYQAIQRSNALTERVCQGIQELRYMGEDIKQIGGKLDKLDSNTTTANYIADLTRKELEYRNYLSYGSTYRYR